MKEVGRKQNLRSEQNGVHVTMYYYLQSMQQRFHSYVAVYNGICLN